ncbi:MAG: hypothetical protein AAFN80_04710 [Pseudomonadota bacterium]
MITNEQIVEAALSPLSNEEIRKIVDCELDGVDFETSDVRLMLAADLISDAALEVAAQLEEKPNIPKVFTLDDSVQLNFAEMSIVGAVDNARRDGVVSMDELQTLLLKSAVANAIANALDSGMSAEDLADSQIALSSIRLSKFLETQSKPKGFLKSLLGRS